LDVWVTPFNDYIKGLDAFTDDVLRTHLIKHGFMEDYRCWNKHG
jgi:hypothetical protein